MRKTKKIVVLGTLMACVVQMGLKNVSAVTEEEFQSLKNKVTVLEKYTFPPEKAEVIKKTSEYVCPRGHTYSSPPEGLVCPIDRLQLKERLAIVKVKLDRREAVGDKISGMLEEEFQKRVNVALSGTGIVQHIADSIENTTKKQTFAQGSVDVYFLSRPMRNTLFFVDMESQGGQGPDSSIANQSVLDNDSTSLPSVTQTDQVRLREAWIQKSFFKQQIQFIIGKIDVTNYFDRNRAANDETSQFVTGTFVNSPLIGNPSNGPGAVTLFDGRRGVSLGLGVQSANASGVNVSEEPFAIAEVGFRARSVQGWLGNFRFWSARNGRVSGDNRDDYSIGMSADQNIGNKTVLFGRVSRSVRKGPGRDPHAWSAGFLFHDWFSQRRRDKLGIAYSHYLTPLGTGLSGETENIGECFYSLFFSDHLTISPIAQVLFHAAGLASGAPQSNVLILGLRTQIDF